MKRYMISQIAKDVQITHSLENNKHQSMLSVSSIKDKRDLLYF